MKAAEDFLLVVLHGHIVAAAETLLKDNNEVSSVHELSAKMVSKFVKLWSNSNNSRSSKPADSTCDDLIQPAADACSDGIFTYASSILTLGLLWMAFYDSKREGDGKKIIMYCFGV